MGEERGGGVGGDVGFLVVGIQSGRQFFSRGMWSMEIPMEPETARKRRGRERARARAMRG